MKYLAHRNKNLYVVQWKDGAISLNATEKPQPDAIPQSSPQQKQHKKPERNYYRHRHIYRYSDNSRNKKKSSEDSHKNNARNDIAKGNKGPTSIPNPDCRTPTLTEDGKV